jgi:site-specific recombinase XerC
MLGIVVGWIQNGAAFLVLKVVWAMSFVVILRLSGP